MPLSVAPAVALEEGDTRVLRPLNRGLMQDVSLARRSGVVAGGPIDVPLVRLGAKDGDLAFFSVRGADTYDITLRARKELRDDDPLSELLWCCGLDPNDDELRHSPWGRLGRALGGESRGRDEVLRRLAVRKDDELNALVAQIERSIGRAASGWPEEWNYRAPILADTQFFVLEGGAHGVRVALGVADSTGQPPRNLHQSPGGLLWLDQPDGFDPDEVERIVRTPPRGLHAAARRPEWSRWLRAEHSARRSALDGGTWRIEPLSEGWELNGIHHRLLVDALEAVNPLSTGLTAVPARRGTQLYPRSAFAIDRLVSTAVRRGLVSIVAEPAVGFRGSYRSGRDLASAALLDVVFQG